VRNKTELGRVSRRVGTSIILSRKSDRIYYWREKVHLIARRFSGSTDVTMVTNKT
jgi:hypothetical protein